MQDTVTLMVLEDIIFPDGYELEAKTILPKVRVVKTGESIFSYMIQSKEDETITHLITPKYQDKVMELGFINEEVFAQIEELKKTGGSIDVSKLLDQIAEMQKTIVSLANDNNELRSELKELNSKYDSVTKFNKF